MVITSDNNYYKIYLITDINLLFKHTLIYTLLYLILVIISSNPLLSLNDSTFDADLNNL